MIRNRSKLAALRRGRRSGTGKKIKWGQVHFLLEIMNLTPFLTFP
jgi:hypothetical protein